MPTLLHNKLAEAIPKCKTMKEAGRLAGYKVDGGSRQIYRASTKRHIAEIFKAQGVTKESLKEAYEQCLELCKKKEDYSTLKATIDSLGKLYGHLKENNVQQNFEKVIIDYTKPENKTIPPVVSSDKVW